VTTETTVSIPAEVFLVNDFDVEFTAPARENYWSHDTRKFGDGQNGTNDGLLGMKATVTVYYFAVNENNNHFVDADGKDITDDYGEPLIYKAGEKLPVERTDAVRVSKNVDITEFVKAKFAEVKNPDPDMDETVTLDTPRGIWYNALSSLKDGEKVSNAQEIEFYYYQDENSQVKLGNGTDPVLMGTKKIYIGVKGDIDLDNKVTMKDAKMTLDYHVAEHNTRLYFQLNADPDLDRCPDRHREPGKEIPVDEKPEQGLPHYLANVCYKKDNEPYLDARDAKAILDYYVAREMTKLKDYDWKDSVGYDFLDEYYPGY
jgi:hypothetical protein